MDEGEVDDLSGLFAAARASVVDWKGEPLYGVYEIKPAPEAFMVKFDGGSRFLRFVKSLRKPVQGLELAATGGTLIIGDVKAAKMVLWQDTAPPETVVRFQKNRRAVETCVKPWNIWRVHAYGSDITMAWLGNSGMRVSELRDGRELLLRCSDGEGPVNFDDLHLRLSIPY